MTSPILTLTGHQSEIFGVDWSPDGAILASASRDRTIRLWSMPTGDPITTISDHRGAVHDVAFAPVGGIFAESVLASASADQTVRLWGIDGTPIKTLEGHNAQVRVLAWSADGTRLVSGGPFWNICQIKIWELPRQMDIGTIHTGKGDMIFCLAVYPEFPLRIAVGLAPGFVQMWQVDEDSQQPQDVARLRCHGEAVRALDFAPDGSLLATGSSDGTVKLWNSRDVMREIDLIHTLKGHTGAVRAVRFSPDGSRIASGGSDGAIRLWDVADGRELVALREGDAAIHSVTWSPDGSRIAAAGTDGVVRVWGVE
jgi:WD40 repeat protein